MSKNILGMKIARGSQTNNHLFFVDDILVFYRANVTEWIDLQNILDTYEAASRQGINKHKTGIFFSFNTNCAMRNRILNLVGVSSCNN